MENRPRAADGPSPSTSPDTFKTNRFAKTRWIRVSRNQTQFYSGNDGNEKSNSSIDAGSQADPRAKNRPISINNKVAMLVSLRGYEICGDRHRTPGGEQGRPEFQWNAHQQCKHHHRRKRKLGLLVFRLAHGCLNWSIGEALAVRLISLAISTLYVVLLNSGKPGGFDRRITVHCHSWIKCRSNCRYSSKDLDS
ncbi:MAG: hypothetical protein ACI9R3_001822 [Verrucomicrobiales bacterium]|jgi:hypothetical protein